MTIVPIRAVDYARRNRLPFAYENPLCSGQVRRDHADVGEKVLHRDARVRFDRDSGFVGPKHVYTNVYRPFTDAGLCRRASSRARMMN